MTKKLRRNIFCVNETIKNYISYELFSNKFYSNVNNFENIAIIESFYKFIDIKYYFSNCAFRFESNSISFENRKFRFLSSSSKQKKNDN